MSNTFSLAWDQCSEVFYLTEGTPPGHNALPSAFTAKVSRMRQRALPPLKLVRRDENALPPSPRRTLPPPEGSWALPCCPFLLSVPYPFPAKGFTSYQRHVPAQPSPPLQASLALTSVLASPLRTPQPHLSSALNYTQPNFLYFYFYYYFFLF